MQREEVSYPVLYNKFVAEPRPETNDFHSPLGICSTT